ncbi:MAG: sodium:calcium antiporter [Deltaproteobacteria bacterium]|nr:sodium:calcium antiporter [Deltaproteobacteria bacterium]
MSEAPPSHTPNGDGRRHRKRDISLFVVSVLLPLPWLLANAVGGLSFPPEVFAPLAGLAILGGAFLLSWATELFERDIPQSLALLLLALISVLPEYAVDLHFAWTAGQDPTYAPYAVANMTGANRLLIGLGWASVVLVSCWKTGERDVAIAPSQKLELRFLLIATLYSFVIPFGGEISLFDALVLFVIFVAYVAAAMRGESHEMELVGPAGMIDREFADPGRRLFSAALFLFAGYAIFISAEPFADGLVELGRERDVDEFLLVQWVAPLASESPEFLVAILFALRLRASVGLGALFSSKVNQWTLLVGAIPVAYAISSGSWTGLPLDARQTEELWLTSAQSLLAVVIIADMRFSRIEALILAVLFLGQLFFPETRVRWAFIVVYLLFALGLVIFGPATRRGALRSLLGRGSTGPSGP